MDSGVSYSIIPEPDYLTIVQYLSTEYGLNCTEPDSKSLVSTSKCKCKDFNDLPDIQLEITNGDKTKS
jgi:hypothetical protein